MRPKTNVYFNALLNNGAPQVFNLAQVRDSVCSSVPTVLSALPAGFNLPTQDVFTVSPNFRTLYTSNATSRSPASSRRILSLSVGYLFTKGTHLAGLPQHQCCADRKFPG